MQRDGDDEQPQATQLLAVGPFLAENKMFVRQVTMHYIQTQRTGEQTCDNDANGGRLALDVRFRMSQRRLQ
jgi:hypothetical protein